jgi:hypothetical protein
VRDHLAILGAMLLAVWVLTVATAYVWGREDRDREVRAILAARDCRTLLLAPPAEGSTAWEEHAEFDRAQVAGYRVVQIAPGPTQGQQRSRLLTLCAVGP